MQYKCVNRANQS